MIYIILVIIVGLFWHFKRRHDLADFILLVGAIPHYLITHSALSLIIVAVSLAGLIRGCQLEVRSWRR